MKPVPAGRRQATFSPAALDITPAADERVFRTCSELVSRDAGHRALPTPWHVAMALPPAPRRSRHEISSRRSAPTARGISAIGAPRRLRSSGGRRIARGHELGCHASGCAGFTGLFGALLIAWLRERRHGRRDYQLRRRPAHGVVSERPDHPRGSWQRHLRAAVVTPVTGQVYAQPLVATKPDGPPESVIVTTEEDNVYALNPTTGAPQWTVNLVRRRGTRRRSDAPISSRIEARPPHP